MAFKGLAITYDGQSLLTQTQISKQFAVKCVRIGDGKYSADHHDIHSMVNPLYDVVPEIQHKDNQLLIEADITSNDYFGYYLREIGIIATDAAGQEVLYAYDNAGNDAEYINPVNSGIAYEKRLRFALIITDDVTINIQVNGSVYALQRDLMQHVDDYNNPHNVTVEQLGLDKVNNTSDKDKPISDATKKALDAKEPVFNKNSAFNKAFGNTAGTVCQGNDSRLSDSRKNPAALTFTGGVTGSYDGSVVKSVYIPTSLPASDVYDWAKQSNKPSYIKSEVGLSNVDNTADKDKPISDATKKALDSKEPAFSKNTAFNKNFGNVADTVCQGNDSRLSDARTPKAHNHDDRYYTTTKTNEIVTTNVEQSKALIMDSVNSVEQRVEYIEENGVVTGDTIPVSGGITCDADKIPTGYKQVEPPFNNSNDIINSDFQVWQRGLDFNPVISVHYTADRWLLYNSDTSRMYYADSLKKGYLNNRDNAHIKQYIEVGILGYTYTMSFSYKLINSLSDSKITVTGALGTTAIVAENSDVSIKFGYDTERGVSYVDIGFKKITEYQLNYVKRELGMLATPHAPRPYAEELMLCQRYYINYHSISGQGLLTFDNQYDDSLYVFTYLGNTQRVKGTINYSEINILTTHTTNTYNGKIIRFFINDDNIIFIIRKNDESIFNKGAEIGYYVNFIGLSLDAEIY